MENQAPSEPQLQFENVQPIDANPPPPPTKDNKWLIIMLSIVSLVAIAVAVFFGYQYFQEKQIVEYSPEPNLVVIGDEIPTPAIDFTKDWETYVDNIYKFSFKYPKNWTLRDSGTEFIDDWIDRNICDLISPGALLDHGQVANGSYFSIGVSKPSPNYKNFSEYLDYSKDQFGYTFKDKQINNISGKIGLTKGKETNYLFERNGHFVNVNWIYSDSHESIDQILSTFELTDVEVDSMASWKRYESSKFGFSFSYPSELIYLTDRLGEYTEEGINSAMILLQNFDGSKPREEQADDFQLVVYVANKTGINLPNPEGEQEIVNIGGVQATKTFTTQKWVQVPTYIFQSKPNGVAIQLSHPNSINKEWFDKIAKSFEFNNYN